MKILIADDDDLERGLLAELLTRYGNCQDVGTGMEAVQRFSDALKDNDPFDVVFLDVIMPHMNGLETLRAMREYEIEHHRLSLYQERYSTILMVTAADDPRTVAAAYLKGRCNGFLPKPITIAMIEERLRSNNLLPLDDKLVERREQSQDRRKKRDRRKQSVDRREPLVVRRK